MSGFIIYHGIPFFESWESNCQEALLSSHLFLQRKSLNELFTCWAHLHSSSCTHIYLISAMSMLLQHGHIHTLQVFIIIIIIIVLVGGTPDKRPCKKQTKCHFSFFSVTHPYWDAEWCLPFFQGNTSQNWMHRITMIHFGAGEWTDLFSSQKKREVVVGEGLSTCK